MQAILEKIYDRLQEEVSRGRVSDYIPELASADIHKLGMAVWTVDGRCFAVGDADEAFSVQSISKVFTLTLALGKLGDAIWSRVGREPSGTAFNSIVQLEYERGLPRNPFINAGAIVVADIILAGHQPREAIAEILRFVRFLADDETIVIDHQVASSEKALGYRNVALASYMRSFDNLDDDVDKILGVYFHQCALSMSCRQLAKSGRYLACDGKLGLDGPTVVSTERSRRINALMLTCGHYDGSGDFAFRVGFPAKSGVGGGILAIVPGQASIAVWSPGLNASGNSLIGTKALEEVARETGWSVFSGARPNLTCLASL